MSRFDTARREALIQDLLARLTGRPADLLPFEDVRGSLRLRSVVDRGILDVPTGKIVGTLGRERDFNRAFLPREESLRERWQKVNELAEDGPGFPPVELYKVGEAYFVVDGHHRVSVAHALSVPTIESRVKEFLTSVPLDASASVEEVLQREGLADFLETTGLSTTDADELRVTGPGGYERLLDHIAVHRYFLGLDQKRDVTHEEAVRSWRETLHAPMVQTIRQSGVLRSFPGRTETDLYLFCMDHLKTLRERYGDAVPARRAVRHFKLTSRGKRRSSRGKRAERPG